MQHQDFVCTAEEWVFSRSYSLVGWADRESYKENWMKFKPFLWLAAVLILGAAGSALFPHPVWTLLIIGPLAAAPVLFIYQIRNMTKRKQDQLIIPEPGEKVVFLRVTPEEMLINLYNQSDAATWYGIRWENVRFIHLDEIKADASQTQWAEINFRKARQKLPNFREEARIRYADRFHLELYTHNNKITWLAVPPSWFEDGTLRSLLQQIRYYTGHTLDMNRTYTPNTLQMINRYLRG